MPYYIGYKGKKLGSALSKADAEEKLVALSRCFNQLEIIKEPSVNSSKETQPLLPLEVAAAVPFTRPIFENTLYSVRK
ncbi:hypothetical protein [Paenibacillus sp. HJGM_3]|uniref:hypothetical protein n=1 Tax=Paenibacillus sp. HJGM_3 TaxID=3379816 RepID=UPI003858E9A9